MQTFVVKKSSIFSFLNYALLAFVVLVFGAQGAYSAVMSHGKDLPIYCVDTNEKKLCITFDAAWGADDTQELIKILDKHSVKATFLLGNGRKSFLKVLKVFLTAVTVLQATLLTTPFIPL